MFCVSIRGIVDTVIKNEEILLCRETAAAFMGLSNGWGIPCKFYTTNKDIINSTYIQGIPVDKINMDNVWGSDGIYCTNKERTICELIKFDCDIQAILESMSNYYYENDECFTDALLSMVKQYDIEEQFNGFIQDAIDYYNE